MDRDTRDRWSIRLPITGGDPHPTPGNALQFNKTGFIQVAVYVVSPDIKIGIQVGHGAIAEEPEADP